MTKKEVRELKAIYYHATMERAGFDLPGERGWSDRAGSAQFTEDVKQQTKLWRESWILGPLAEIIQKHDPTFKAEDL